MDVLSIAGRTLPDPDATSGFVSLVSAGPGDPGLLTLKAAERLRDADVVLYDALVSQAVLDHSGPQAERIAVGKRARRPSAKQEFVNELLVEQARSGRRVVRLKSGDAGIFGRLEEEIVALDAAGIGWEIVPGVTSASAAAAVAGLPLTRRLTARRLQYVTAADVTGKLPADLNWAALADPLAVTVVFMGQRTFPAMAAELIARGLPATTPALFAEAVGHPAERLVRTDIAGLATMLETAEITHPALILYGALAPAREPAAGSPVSGQAIADSLKF
ncbi:uroporphyrinogen-III C-methyltransferase (plasmid) [Paracoccus sp. TK19116]|uniref:uroporphyrinogen-III C-methyltransferase n=1 Tax=Paracoccus albicereus TaxID=2922394 RepID=A0ABT1ML73_9RHOB|nr:uroporphyrinogen-III C-methyltransferase [Paracoccus albicereus]MCQ0969038.1 uroporphyrinogen-III C-methyltransferase [Paracoccus albicereus]